MWKGNLHCRYTSAVLCWLPSEGRFSKAQTPVRSPNPILWKRVALRHQAGIPAFENLPQVPYSVGAWAPINKRWGCSALQGIKPTMFVMAFTSHQKRTQLLLSWYCCFKIILYFGNGGLCLGIYDTLYPPLGT